MRHVRWFTVWYIVGALTLSARAAEPTLHVEIVRVATSVDETLEGRLYVFFSDRAAPPPMQGPNWFAPEPFFRVDLPAFRPGDRVTLDDTAAGFPGPLSSLEAGTYWVQAVFDHGFYAHHHAREPGNLYSEPVQVTLADDAPSSVTLHLDQVIESSPFPESERLREVVLPNPLLSSFHGRDVVDRAAVLLPEGYDDQPTRRYPVVYIVPGFGGTHRTRGQWALPATPSADRVEFIRVLLNGDCKWGHHVYADSATNGPRGQALVEEMIPHIDATFRTIAAPTARFVTGHSSGGWSSLWLQVNYPDTFGGVWSTSPDPVDFRDFQRVDLYADPPQSLYYDEQSQPRPLARRDDEPVLWFPSFAHMDDVLGRGGQLRSFEAVFSPLDEEGLPRQLWNRGDGRIDPEVARAWQAYDIRLLLERNWPMLEPKLRGKLHITTGEHDTFYLEGAVIKLAAALEALGSDAVIEIVPDANHSSLLTPEYYARVHREMTAAFLRHHPLESADATP